MFPLLLQFFFWVSFYLVRQVPCQHINPCCALSLCYGNFGALIHRLLPWYFCDCAEAPLAPESIGLWASSHCRNLQEVRSTSAGTMLLHPSLVLIPVITDLEAPNKGSVGSLPVKVTVVISCLSLRWQATKLLPPLLGPHLCE